MRKNKRLRHGIGAKISVYKKFLHPRKAVSTKYPNATKNDVLENLLVIGQEEKLVSKRREVCLTMRHDDFDDGQILHAVARFCKVTEEGPVESLFDILSRNDVENDKNVTVGDDENTEHEIPSVLNEYQIFEHKDSQLTTITSLLPKIFRLQLTLTQMICTNPGEVNL